jgi:hypothetical protein
LRHSHVGVVRFAAPDAMWHGIEQMRAWPDVISCQP